MLTSEEVELLSEQVMRSFLQSYESRNRRLISAMEDEALLRFHDFESGAIGRSGRFYITVDCDLEQFRSLRLCAAEALRRERRLALLRRLWLKNNGKNTKGEF